jgi:pimeloyl-ACP methyl ester carboxylesterase
VPTHAHADVNGIRMHYAMAGRADAPVGRADAPAGRADAPLLVFLHGFPEFWYAWRDQLAEFGRDHRVVAPDMRGYNLSSRPAAVEAYRIEHLVEDVRALVRHLQGGGRRFTLVGHDWGGAVAWAFALAHPGLLDGLVVVNMAHPVVFLRELATNPVQQKASTYITWFRRPDSAAKLLEHDCARLSRMTLDDLLARGLATDDDRRRYVEAWTQPGAVDAGLNYYRAARLGPPTPEEPVVAARMTLDPAHAVVEVPTLVIWGERDEALPVGNLDGLERYVPKLTLRRVPDGSHWVVHEHPALVNRYIREFLAERTEA